jgi:cytoskeletal protein CcmA (bactofilin family)
MWDQEKKDCSVIGEDLIVNGDINCKSDLMIEGKIEGNVVCMSLFVGKSGRVTGDVNTEEVLIEGTIHGKITSGSVELKDGCILEGDISSKTLAVDHGATFTGSVKPTVEANKAGIKEAAE